MKYIFLHFVEEEKKEGDQTDAAEGKTEEGKTGEGEQPPPQQQEGEEEPASQTRTVEVTVEGEQGVCVCVHAILCARACVCLT